MASEIDQLVVRIAGDARALQKALKSAEKEVKGFAAKAGKSMQKVGKGMQDVGKSMTKYITAPLMAIGAVGLHAFSKFDDNLTKSAAIMGDVTEHMGAMKAAALEVGNTTTISSQAAAESFFFLASAGLSARETIEALPIVANMAVAGNMDMATATDLVTDAQSALGLSVGSTANKMKEMTRVSDVLTQANILANATIEQYATALTSKAGAALKAVNKTIEEGVAVLAVMADQGVKAQLAGNSLNRMLLMLQQSAQRNKKAHEDLGFAVYDVDGNMRNMADIVQNLEVVLSGMSAEQKAATMTEMGFAAEVQAVINPLLGQSAALKDKQAALEDAAGKTEEVAKKQLKSFAAQMKIMWNQIRNVAMEIGEKLAPMLTFLANKIKDGLAWYKAQSDAFKNVVFWTGLFAAALGPIIFMLGTVITLVGGLALGLKALATAYAFESVAKLASAAAQWVLNAAMAAMPYAIFLVAVAAIVKLSQALYNANGAVQELNKQMERGKKLNEQLKKMRAESEEATDASIAAEEDPAEKIRRLNEELERAKKNQAGYAFGVKNAEKEAAKLAPTMLSLWQSGKAVHEVALGTIEEQQERLEHTKERAEELKEQLAAAKEEQAKLNALQTATGIGSQSEMLIVEEQLTNLQEMNKELKEQEATVGMTKGEIELYKAEQNGASEASMDVLRAIELENQVIRENIKEKEEAAKATAAAAEAEKKLKTDITSTTRGMADSVDTFGMTSREVQLYKLEMRGATEEELEMARALDAKLTELEKEKKAMEEHKALMKKGEALTKSLRTEEEKLADGEKELGEMLKAGAIDLETYERGMTKLHEKTKEDIKVKFKVSGVEAVIAGTADAAARLEEFRALSKKQDKDPPVDFKKQGQEIKAAGQDEMIEKAFKSAQPSEADKAIKVAADKELKRQEEEKAAAEKLAAEKKAARDKELEQLRQQQQDNKDVAAIRQWLNTMDDQQEHVIFGGELKSQMEASRQQDEFGNISTEFLKENLDQFRASQDEFNVMRKLTSSEDVGGKGMTVEAAKQMIKDQGIEAVRKQLAPPVDPKLSGKQTQAQLAEGMTNAQTLDHGLDEFVNMDEALQEIKESTNKMAENNLVVIEPANIGA
tara:strand:- start:14837 stop:18178 length:3342 start_codon:yes stop_codon:yes gene_type:complete